MLMILYDSLFSVYISMILLTNKQNQMASFRADYSFHLSAWASFDDGIPKNVGNDKINHKCSQSIIILYKKSPTLLHVSHCLGIWHFKANL